MRESVVERYLRNRCVSRGWLCLKWGSAGVRGVPDRIVITQTSIFFVELKAPGKKPTPLQAEWHRRLRSRKQRVYVVDSRESVDKLMREL